MSGTSISTPVASRRRWFRFSLRAFLLFVAVASIWLGWIVSRARTQRVAIAAIEAAGGTIHFDYHEAGSRTWSTAGKPRGPQWLRDRLGTEYFDWPVYVALSNAPEDGGWVESFNQLPSIKTLLLSGPHVTDDTLARLNGSNALLELHLSNAAISDDGLKHLAKFPNLHWLILNHTRITDAGVAHLAGLRMLQELNLDKTKVSDESIPFIIQFPELQTIDLRGTAVTEAGAERVREHDPKTKVLR